MVEHDAVADLDRALRLIVEVFAWIEATPEPQIELDTAVRWQEGIVAGLSQLSQRTLTHLDQQLERWSHDAPLANVAPSLRESLRHRW